MGATNKRQDNLVTDENMVGAIDKYLSQFPTLIVGSKQYKPADIVRVLQERIEAGKAVIAAEAARTAAVKAYRDKRSETSALMSSFRRMIQGMFTQSPDTLAAFGLKAPRVGKRSAENKAGAVVKGKATRKARNTLGKRQKKAIKGTGPTAASGTAPSPATPTKPAS